MAAISDYLENKLLDHSLGTLAYSAPAQVYLALHTATPGEAGSGAEVTGGSYSRKAIDFGAASGGSASNNAGVSFTGMPAVTVTHIGLWDAATAGNLLFYGALTSSKTLNSGDTFTVQTGDLTVTLD